MRMTPGAICYHGARAVGLTAVNRRLSGGGVILCYHNVVRAEDARAGGASLHMPLDRFERQMRWLASRYRVVPLREFVERVASGATLRLTAAITFDDAYAGVFEHAVPCLKALGLPATVFVVTGAAERPDAFWWDQPAIVSAITPALREQWLTALRGDGCAILSGRRTTRDLPASHRPADWAAIRARLGGGIDIGVHSATHRTLTALADAELGAEISASRVRLQEATGVSAEFFAYPYGRWNPRVRAAVRAAGYTAGLTLDGGLNGPRADSWALRRVNVPADISDAAFDAWTSGLAGRRSQ